MLSWGARLAGCAADGMASAMCKCNAGMNVYNDRVTGVHLCLVPLRTGGRKSVAHWQHSHGQGQMRQATQGWTGCRLWVLAPFQLLRKPTYW